MSDTGGSFGGQPGRRVAGAGGTPGGVGEFFLGLILAGIGGYLLFNQVQVHTSFWRFGGLANSFGISLIPMLLGVAILFYNGKSTIGRILTFGGLLFIIVGIIANMDIYFQRTSLFNTLVMLVLIAGGLGLIFKSLRPH
jgi:multisubunit Na+/H+ antiporter MnhF subunit